MGTISQIVVGLDGSEGAEGAAAWCADMAAAAGAQVVAVFGCGKLPDVFRGAPDAVIAGLDLTNTQHHGWKRDAQERLERWCEPFRTAGVPYRTALVENDGVHALLKVADDEHADLIVVGAQGHGGVVGRILGGVTYKLAHHARIPVVIVPGGPPEA